MSTALINGYLILCAIGFPVLLMHWAGYERKASIHDYRTGYDDGWEAREEQKEHECEWREEAIELQKDRDRLSRAFRAALKQIDEMKSNPPEPKEPS